MIRINKIKIPDIYNSVKQVILSPDGTRVAYIGVNHYEIKMVNTITKYNLERLFLDSISISPLSWSIKEPRFSADGKNIAYISVNNSTDRFWTLWLNNKNVSSLYAKGEYTINSDGSKISYIALKDHNKINSGACIMVNDKELVDEAESRILKFVWNWDNTQIAYKIGSQFNMMTGYKLYCIKQNNQKVSPDLSEVSPPVFALHSDKPSYAAKEGKTWSIYSGNNKITQDYDQIDTFVYSPDGKQLALKAKLKSVWYIFLNGEKISVEVDKRHVTPVFSPDGSKLAYIARVNGNWSVFIGNQKISPDFDNILTDPIFSPDGSRVVYVAKIGENKFVMINDKKISPDFDNIKKNMALFIPEITLIGFNDDGSKLVYKVEYHGTIHAGSLEPIFILKSFLMINDRLVSSNEDTFIIGDAKITGKGVYFAGYNRIKSTSNGLITKQTWDANVYHGFVKF